MSRWAPLLIFLVVQTPLNADYNVGLSAYDRGDYSTAIKEFAKSAKQGDTDSQYYTGTLYYRGEGVPQDYEQAAKWFRIAAAHGHAEAQLQLGTMYGLGIGIPKDDKEAVKWYKAAAEQGLAEAQNSLGVRHERGQGVTQDYLQAYAWFSLAADQEHGIATENRDLVAGQITADQMSKADLLIQNLKAQLAPTMTAKVQDNEKSDDSALPEPNNVDQKIGVVIQVGSPLEPSADEETGDMKDLGPSSEPTGAEEAATDAGSTSEPKASQQAMASPEAEPKNDKATEKVGQLDLSSEATKTTGHYWIRLLALPITENAYATWIRLKDTEPDLLGDLGLTIVRNASEQERFTLQAGPLSDELAALQLCNSLIARKIECDVVRPSP